MISLLNSCYVPVYASNEDYRDRGSAPPEERAEYNRIYLEFVNGNLGSGTVHVYILKPDGHALNGLDIGAATDTPKMIARLEEDARTLNVVPGSPAAAPRVVSAAPKAGPDSLVLHLTARAEGTGPTGGSWHEFPSENWIVLDRGDCSKILPPGMAMVGAKWEVDRETALKLLVYFYPQTEQTEDAGIARNRIDALTLHATVVASSGGLTTVRLDGSLRMKHTFYPGKDDDNFVDAKIVGYVEWDSSGRRVRSFTVVTDKATYGKTPFSVAVRSVP